MGAADVDEIARCLLADLTALPGVHRVGLALTEGGGRRLRFVASDRLDGDDTLDWCHIDAYDDVPLTEVVRTGEPMLGGGTGWTGGTPSSWPASRSRCARWRPYRCPASGRRSAGHGVPRRDLDLRRTAAPAPGGDRAAYLRSRPPGPRRRHPGPEPSFAEEAHDVDRAARVLLDDDPRSVGLARRFLRELLDESEVSGDVADNALLCLSELVTNAVVHASTVSERAPPSTAAC